MDIRSFERLIEKKDGGTPSTVVLTKKIGLSRPEALMCNKLGKFPLGQCLEKVLAYLGMTENELRLKVGSISLDLRESLLECSKQSVVLPERNNIAPPYKTKLGVLYNDDCLSVLNNIHDESIDLIFADPPFNLSKDYPSKINDNLLEDEYIRWCEKWILECCRTLKYGGSFYLWNLPKWNSKLSSIIEEYLTFRHWIAVDIKYSLPISGKLYPSHYSLLYFVKGERPNVFNPDRLEMKTCRKCFNEIKDYGGYKNKMNKLGINLSDVWDDISPVRHKKYKTRNANELSLKLLDRIIQMSTSEGDVVLDPFGGSGTTYIAAELKGRQWIGCEIGPIDGIKERFQNILEEIKYLNSIRNSLNCLFTETISQERKKRKIWTPEDFE